MAHPSYSIRVANHDDIHELIDMYRYLHAVHQYGTDEEYTYNSINKLLHKQHTIFFVAEFNDGIIGFIQVTKHRHPKETNFLCRTYGYVYAIAVRPEHHRRGVATQLLQKAERWLQSFGINIIELNVATRNKNASACYQNLGYITIEKTDTSRKMVHYIPHNDWEKH